MTKPLRRAVVKQEVSSDTAVTAPSVTVRSEGQRLFMAIPGSLATIAAELGQRSPQAVLNWRNGSRPSEAARARIWNVYGIPPRAWSVRPGALEDEPPRSEVRPSSAPKPHPSALEDCLALLAVVREDRNQRGLLPSERVKLTSAEAQILTLRAKLEQSAEFAEARYVTEHPSWLKLRRAILVALEPHPLAAQAVIDAIERLERSK